MGIFLLAAVAGCRERRDDLPTERRVPLPGEVGPEASLRIDEQGRRWVVEPGRALVLDTGTAARPARITVGEGTPLPAPRWDPAGRLYVDRGRPALAALAHGEVTVPSAPRVAGPVERDPRGRWIYAAVRGGGVVGLDAETLRPAWGWPEAGAAAGAMAVSPLGDRVYLALDADRTNGHPPRVQVRDAQTGRVLASLDTGEPVRALVAGPDGTLFGVAQEDEAGGAGRVFALRPGPAGLAEAWAVSLRRLGLEAPVRLRLSPAGDRVAVFAGAGREGGGLRVLDAAGRVTGQMPEAPLDAAFDAAGRLHLLGPRELRTIR